ncbi:hypothetical protein N7474_003787 [Penicillium riverlandense]|uniref:uncharacterized protein n=1 Tax=Penicillium riverlandense TaxID=1903569 RepID=UPI0025486F7E|nr:uncharacterized protein N7474_003787 [Penicillium riverlandense]KAJ5818196.1 hypothetical protein N7474_003787 [Penicillium riverlandense]
MASSAQLSALEAFLQDHPTIKYTPPSSPEYASARKVWNNARLDNPLAVVQPQSPSDIVAIIKFAKFNSVPFTLRSGGHNLEGRSVVENALLIDLRALKAVTIASDRKTALVQGGILLEELGSKLWEEGLVTPTGATPSVGYVGWAIYGGYGPFSSQWGLGTDQIVGATVINPDGEIITADETLLQGIRGAGGLFGVIVDLTIKVYPLNSVSIAIIRPLIRFGTNNPKLLAGTIIYDSTDISKTFVDFNAAYGKILDSEGLPPQLTIQQIAVNAPPGRCFGVIFVWSGSDIDEGQRWSAKVAGLAPLLMNTVALTTIPEWFGHNGALVPADVFGSSATHNISRILPAVAETIGRNLERMPTDPATMFSIHQLRGPSAAPQDHSSVFVTREPHYMLEILGYVTEERRKEESEAWALQTAKEIEEADPDNVLPTTYLSVYSSARAGTSDAVLKKAYGSNVEMLRSLKSRFDPDNVFRLAVPAME